MHCAPYVDVELRLAHRRLPHLPPHVLPGLVAVPQALKEANDNLLPLTDTLLFVHGVGNLVLASAQDWFPQCALPAGSHWFEIQVRPAPPVRASRRVR